MRNPDYDYFYYLPPIGIICDLIRNGFWKSFLGLTEDSLVNLSKYCLSTNGYSIFTSHNMERICEEYGMKKAASVINSIHNNSFYDHSTVQIMLDVSRCYHTSKVNLLNNQGTFLLLESKYSLHILPSSYSNE